MQELEEIVKIINKYDRDPDIVANEYIGLREYGLKHYPTIQLLEMKYSGQHEELFDPYHKEKNKFF